MTAQLIQQIEESFGDVSSFSPAKMQALIQETLKYFQVLQEKIASGDDIARQQALEDSLKLKAALEEQASKLCALIGIDPTQLAEMVKNPNNFSKGEWDSLSTVKEELANFKKELHLDEKKPVRMTKKRPAKQWVMG
jgi:hypothetical protein